MEALHHELLIVQVVNMVLGPVVALLLRPLGYEFPPGEDVIPDFLVMCMVIVVALVALAMLVRSRLSVESPGKLQIILEDGIGGLSGMLEEWIGPKGLRYLPIV